MIVLRTISEVRAARAKLGRLALVPTMGALHAGHLSLVEIARKHAPKVAVSIFVNPTQFGPREDFSKYPRPIESDLKMCKEAGVDLVFNPSAAEMYPPDAADIVIDLPSLTDVLEGRKRPGHFKGVCQVVGKLFNIFRPNVACFGQKDYQQLRIISAMVRSLDWRIRIVRCPTMRDEDGLAMSSRNQYLSAEERQRALSIRRALVLARREVKAGRTSARHITSLMEEVLEMQNLQIDYVAVVDPMSLRNVAEVNKRALLAIAARVGATRLIDNVIVKR